MIEKIKLSKNIKLLMSMFIFALSGLFFINSTPVQFTGSNCYSCGSWDSCYDGDPTLQSGWESCRHVTGTPPCEVYGAYGSCNSGGPGEET